MPVDLLLDPATGDLAHPVALARDRGAGADRPALVRQRLELRLGLIRGEWFLDRAEGPDWLSVLGRPPDEERARAVAVQAALEDPDVAAAEADVAIDRAARRVEVSLRATLSTGEVVEVAATVGA